MKAKLSELPKDVLIEIMLKMEEEKIKWFREEISKQKDSCSCESCSYVCGELCYDICGYLKLPKDVLIEIMLKMEEEKIKWFREEIQKQRLYSCSSPSCLKWCGNFCCDLCRYKLCQEHLDELKEEEEFHDCGGVCILCYNCMKKENRLVGDSTTGITCSLCKRSYGW